MILRASRVTTAGEGRASSLHSDKHVSLDSRGISLRIHLHHFPRPLRALHFYNFCPQGAPSVSRAHRKRPDVNRRLPGDPGRVPGNQRRASLRHELVQPRLRDRQIVSVIAPDRTLVTRTAWFASAPRMARHSCLLGFDFAAQKAFQFAGEF